MLALPLPPSATLWRCPPQQLLLAGILSAGPPRDGYFLAIFPEPVSAYSIEGLAHRQRAKHGLSGRPLATHRFHITLHHFGHYHGPRPDFVEMAGEAAAKITAAPFQVAFDRVLSFRHMDDRPLVLRARGRATALKEFQRELGVALTKTGLGRKVMRSFTPHVTLLYDREMVAEHAVETVGWMVKEFVLVHSLIGQTKHIVLARWPLRGELTATRDAGSGGTVRF